MARRDGARDGTTPHSTQGHRARAPDPTADFKTAQSEASANFRISRSLDFARAKGEAASSAKARSRRRGEGRAGAKSGRSEWLSRTANGGVLLFCYAHNMNLVDTCRDPYYMYQLVRTITTLYCRWPIMTSLHSAPTDAIRWQAPSTWSNINIRWKY